MVALKPTKTDGSVLSLGGSVSNFMTYTPGGTLGVGLPFATVAVGDPAGRRVAVGPEGARVAVGAVVVSVAVAVTTNVGEGTGVLVATTVGAREGTTEVGTIASARVGVLVGLVEAVPNTFVARK